jgi:hypothetical protein
MLRQLFPPMVKCYIWLGCRIFGMRFKLTGKFSTEVVNWQITYYLFLLPYTPTLGWTWKCSEGVRTSNALLICTTSFKKQLIVLGFKLWALSLLARCSTTWVMPLALYTPLLVCMYILEFIYTRVPNLPRTKVPKEYLLYSYLFTPRPNSSKTSQISHIQDSPFSIHLIFCFLWLSVRAVLTRLAPSLYTATYPFLHSI